MSDPHGGVLAVGFANRPTGIPHLSNAPNQVVHTFNTAKRVCRKMLCPFIDG
ncbi:MAG: hypothetical protein IPJ18_18990 [Betaproteobacteria bacterium]|nr:hypothetical protein [Betaproteobacteria bacterium]